VKGGFDARAVFDDDYLYFYEDLLSDEHSDKEAKLIWSLGSLQPGARVLDLACGHGRLANRLAACGASVVGVDATSLFLDRARRDALTAGLNVEYVEQDMRELSRRAEFDVVLSWFTAFGYFDDDTDRSLLRRMYDALLPRGRLLLDLNNGPRLMRIFLPAIVTRRDADAMVDEHTWDPQTARVHTHRTVIRDGATRSFDFSVRIFAFPEIRDWLLAAGFTRVEAFDDEGESLRDESRRMVVRATRS
jgi:SAM-dependent methyltransferase